VCEKRQAADAAGPQPSGCFSVLTTLVGKSPLVFEKKASVYSTLGLLSTLPSSGR
jgi:hypothetical protein